ncbi:MAG: nuclear transport factor 2 family protein [Hellea sp.]
MSLEDRITRIEAELAIRNVIARYGLAADCGDITTALKCHVKDAVYVVSNPGAGRDGESGDLKLYGHRAIADMLSSDMHQSLIPDCAHTVGPLVVEVKEDTAQVKGFSRVYHEQRLMRLAVNHWHLRKTDEAWKISRRESRLIGEPAAQDLLKKGFEE